MSPGALQQLLQPLRRGLHDRQCVAHAGLTQPVRPGHGHGCVGQAEEVVHVPEDQAVSIHVDEPLVLRQAEQMKLGQRLRPHRIPRLLEDFDAYQLHLQNRIPS